MALPPEAEAKRRRESDAAATRERDQAPVVVALEVSEVSLSPPGNRDPRAIQVPIEVHVGARVIEVARGDVAPGAAIAIGYREWTYVEGAAGAAIDNPLRPARGQRLRAFLRPVAPGRYELGGSHLSFEVIEATLKSSVRQLADYELLVLDRLAATASVLADLRQAVYRYPANPTREGAIVQSLRACLAGMNDLDAVRSGLETELARRGGRETLEAVRDAMDFDEFISGWDDD